MKKAPEKQPKKHDTLQAKAKSYFESYKKINAHETVHLRETAKNTSLIELRGGHEWLKAKNYHEKFAKISQIYLNYDTKSGTFTVKNVLHDNNKIKYGLGAGHVLPPSITEVEITDTKGKTRRGTREVRKGLIGYYDGDGYISIFAGYKIKPVKFLDEKTSEYAEKLKKEQEYYQKKKKLLEAARAARSEFNKTGIINEAVADTTSNLRSITAVDYRFTALKDQKKYPARGRENSKIGDFCCAYAVSTWLGLGEDSGDKRGKEGNVERMAKMLIRGNYERTGNPGIINTRNVSILRRGDVTIFGRPEKYRHIGVITFNRVIEIKDGNGESLGNHRVLGFLHTGRNIAIEPILILPNSSAKVRRAFEKSLKNNNLRQNHYFANYGELREMWEAQGEGKKPLKIKDERGWGARTGKMAFAIKTQGLAAPETMLA